VIGCHRRTTLAGPAPAAGRPRCRRPWTTPPWPGSPPVSLGVPSSRGALGLPFLRPLACRVILGRASRPGGLYRGADESAMRPTANLPTPATLHRPSPSRWSRQPGPGRPIGARCFCPSPACPLSAICQHRSHVRPCPAGRRLDLPAMTSRETWCGAWCWRAVRGGRTRSHGRSHRLKLVTTGQLYRCQPAAEIRLEMRS
jgi:hypothetical protein